MEGISFSNIRAVLRATTGTRFEKAAVRGAPIFSRL